MSEPSPARLHEENCAVRFGGVSKSFGQRAVLRDISLAVLAGTAYVLLGRSGTGKSVILKLICGLIRPDSGSIGVGGEDITHLDSAGLTAIRKRMGFLFQNAALFDSISVGENVAFPLRRHTDMPETEIRERSQSVLETLGLGDEYDSMPSNLSGGMRKRAGLARALVLEPSILLVDEPTAGLDPVTSSEIDDLLLAVKQDNRATLVVVTHNIPSARAIADRMAFLDGGRILAEGTVAELASSEMPLVRSFMASRQGG